MATISKERSFPAPTDRPGAKYVLIYDGHCRFCAANIQWISAVDQGRVAYLSLHDPEVQSRWPDLSYEQLMKHMYLIDLETGSKYPGAAAFKFLSRKLVAFWPIAPLLHVPGTLPIWQFLYSRIARVRYSFGRIKEECDGTCELHFD